jgi:methionyl-tRNA formyltransferase
MRVLMFGDGPWAAKSLVALGETNCELVGVVTRHKQSDSTLEDAARYLALPVLRPANAGDRDFVELVSRMAPDLGLSISYNQILRRPLLDCARLGFVNFHAGKLPYYRGRNIISWAIINGELEIGLTAHFVDEGIDTGDILLQRTFPISWTDTYGDVLGRIVENFPAFVVDALNALGEGKTAREPQSHIQGTYFSGREDGDEWLDWSDTSFNLYNKIRAITRPAPGARTLLGDAVVIVWSAQYDPSWPKYIATPGQVVGRNGEGVVVKTGDSTLILREIQIDGGNCHTPAWPIGTRLGMNLLSIIRSLQSRVVELEGRLQESDKSHGAGCSR